MDDVVVELLAPQTDADWAAASNIVSEYAESLSVDLGFQNFEHEFADLCRHYAPPQSLLLLAVVDGAVVGCGGFRPLADADYPNACEMKRLYVRRPFRRFGLGRQIAEALMGHALEAGYTTMLLDTLNDMEAARELYASLGFVDVPPYYYNPIPGAHYLKADLLGGGSRY